MDNIAPSGNEYYIIHGGVGVVSPARLSHGDVLSPSGNETRERG